MKTIILLACTFCILSGSTYDIPVEAFEIAIPESIVEEVAVIEEPVVIEEPTVEYFNVPLSEDLQDHIFELCEQYGVEPSIIVAMIERESTFRSGVIGDNGNSFGLMQIQPRWNHERMSKLGCQDLLDPYQNVAVGIDILAEHIDKGRGIEWALMAYNGGPSYANKWYGQGIVSDYARSVLSRSVSW